MQSSSPRGLSANSNGLCADCRGGKWSPDGIEPTTSSMPSKRSAQQRHPAAGGHRALLALQGYVHMDAALVVAADGVTTFAGRPKRRREGGATFHFHIIFETSVVWSVPPPHGGRSARARPRVPGQLGAVSSQSSTRVDAAKIVRSWRRRRRQTCPSPIFRGGAIRPERGAMASRSSRRFSIPMALQSAESMSRSAAFA